MIHGSGFPGMVSGSEHGPTRGEYGRMREPAARTAAAAADGPQEDVVRPTVLVVEDDAHDREIYGRILCYNGYDVVFAHTGQSGLGLAREYRPDLILLDMGLPDLPGLDVCARLREWHATASVPVVVLSAFAEAHMGDRAREAGCALYIEKPASPVSVLHAIERLIGKAPLPGVGRPPRMIEPEAE
jgi:two-component system, cell cycle response regulator DivK